MTLLRPYNCDNNNNNNNNNNNDNDNNDNNVTRQLVLSAWHENKKDDKIVLSTSSYKTWTKYCTRYRPYKMMLIRVYEYNIPFFYHYHHHYHYYYYRYMTVLIIIKS